MSDKIISLEAKRNEPIEELVEALGSLLERAKTGELRSVVYLAFGRDGAWESGNAGERLNRAYVMGAFQQAGLDYYHRRREED